MLPASAANVLEEKLSLRLSNDFSHLLMMNMHLLCTASDGAGKWIAGAVEIYLDAAELFYCLIAELVGLLPLGEAVINASVPLRFGCCDC